MHRYAVRQSDGKRILAGFLDFVFVLVLSIFIFWPIEAVAVTMNYGYNNSFQMELDATLLYSELYEGNPETGQIAIIDEIDKYPKALYNFYVDKRHPVTNALQRGFSPILNPSKVETPNSFNTAEDYYIYVLEKDTATTLFDFSAIDHDFPWEIAVKSGNEKAVRTFYEEQFMTALNLLAEHERVSFLTLKTTTIAATKLLIIYLIAATILVLILPLFFSDSVTLGKLVTKTTISDANGFKATKGQGILRNVAMFIFSYVFFFMPFHLISLIASVVRKNKQSLYDFLSRTVVLNKETSLVFADETELLRYQKKLAKILIEQERRKAKRLEEEQ